MPSTMRPVKTLHIKISSSQIGQYLSTRRQNNLFFISDILFTIITHFQSSKIFHVTVFGDNCCPHIRNSYLVFKTLFCETLILRTLLFIFQANVQIFLNFSERENKQVTAKMFQKGLFLTVYTRWLDSLMTSQNASFGQVLKYAWAGFQYTFFLSARMCWKRRRKPIWLNNS